MELSDATLPTKPPAFDRQGITPDDLIEFTPALKAAALQALEGFKIGPIYTPAVQVTTGPNAVKGTIRVPGLWRWRELAVRRG